MSRKLQVLRLANRKSQFSRARLELTEKRRLEWSGLKNAPVKYFGDAAVRDLQLPADFARPRALQCEPEDLVPQVVRQRAPVRELAPVLVHVAATCTRTSTHTHTHTLARCFWVINYYVRVFTYVHCRVIT